MTSSSIVSVFAALGDDTRWQLLQSLGRGAATASQLADSLPITRQAIVRHLHLLQKAGLVRFESRGREVYAIAIGSELSAVAELLHRTATEWQPRLERLKLAVEASQSR